MKNMEERDYIIDLLLEEDEVLDFDEKTGNLKISKQIFDGYVENAYIVIGFVDDNSHNAYSYKMIAEDSETISLEYMGG